MSSVDFDEDFEDIDDIDDVIILDEEEEEDEDEKLEEECDVDKVNQDEFEIELDDNDEDEEIDIDVLDIEEKVETEEVKKNITVPFITKYEYPKIISTRAQQIACGAPILIDINDPKLKKKKPMEIAELELATGKLNNIKIKRVLPNGKIEMRKLSELKFYSFY